MKGYIQLQNYIHFNNLEETYRNFKSLENFFFPVLFAKMKTPGRFAQKMPRQNFDQGLTVVSCCIIRVYISSVLISKNQNPKKKKKKNHKTRRWYGIMNPLKEN